MNLLSWLGAISVLIFIMAQAITFHRSTVCRQEAWLKSTELITRSLLSKAPEQEKAVLPKCRILLVRKGPKVNWNNRIFELQLESL